MKNYPKISIVIPAYNEASRLPASIKKLRGYLDKNSVKAEVLIVVEKSHDQTLTIAQTLTEADQRFRVIGSDVHYGKGYAVKTGVLASRGGLVFFMDADMSTDLASVGKFIDYFAAATNTDILIGSRAMSQSKITLRQNLIRQTMGKTFNLFVRLLLGLHFRDTQCGFKAFRKNCAHKLFSDQVTSGFAFDVEILARAQKSGYAVKELPVRWHNSKDSRVNLFTGPLSMFWEVIKIRFLIH